MAAGMRRSDEQAQDAARKAGRSQAQRRHKGQGPRPSAPKLVEGPAVSRSSGRVIGRYRDERPADEELGGYGAPDQGQRGRFRQGEQRNPVPAPQGFIGADANPRARKGPGVYNGKNGRPGSPGGQGGPRKGPRR